MAETLTLAAAEVIPQITTTDYRVIYLLLDFEHARIVIHVRGTNGEHRQFMYEKQTATDLMVALNKANLTTKSLQRRVLERLAADGLLVGSVTGTPD